MKKRPNKENTSNMQLFHALLVVFLIITFIISVAAYKNTLDLKKVIPGTINAEDFLKKLTAHEETKQFTGISPLNIIQINEENLNNLQSQIQGLDESFLNSFIVQYQDAIIVYDYDSDEIKGTLQFDQGGQLPPDFFEKLNKHSQVQGLESEQPVGGRLDESTLDTLQQQFPEVYKDAKVGDFLLRYQSKLIVYDYNQNKIITEVLFT